jgi:hypothetical protein
VATYQNTLTHVLAKHELVAGGIGTVG